MSKRPIEISFFNFFGKFRVHCDRQKLLRRRSIKTEDLFFVIENNFIFSLSMDVKKLVEENKAAIREDEPRKQQALEQFRDWLSKHPFISNTRQGKKSITERFNWNNCLNRFRHTEFLNSSECDFFFCFMATCCDYLCANCI